MNKVSSNAELKSRFRKNFRHTLSQIPIKYRIEAAHSAAKIFTQQTIFTQSEHIACYFYFKDELDARPMMEAIWQEKKQCYLPVLTLENTLRFIRYNKDDALQANRYGIFEPVDLTRQIKPQDLDIVLAPLIAFDLQGRRLGAGGGYYDRTFSFLHNNQVKRPLFLGLAYAAQQTDGLQSDEWDVNLKGVVTEKGYMNFCRLG